MKQVVAIAAALMLVGTAAASAASKHHPRHARHARTPAVHYAPVSRYAPAPPIERPRAYGVPPGTCIQDEGYGRWTYCGQGAPGAR